MKDETPAAHFLGLRTVIYHAPDLDRAKTWYTSVLRLEPYFDMPFYVGYDVGGYELGLDPDASSTPQGDAGAVAYWGVPNAQEALAHLISLGATARTGPQTVGKGIRVATVLDPFGNVLGIIENPHFRLHGDA
ncbi:MAG: VOC family protein [Chthoniobacterales bacterium]|jgi:predicted enzyme related to lactoylglutathione lyase|nr:VOC family protein [Chthoniobacterales bacterium]